MMKPSSCRVLVAGAGIGGLTAALALIKRGFDVEVHEQAPDLGDVGAGIQMSANGSRLLQELGLTDALARIAVEPVGKEIRLWNTGQTWKLFDLGMVSVERYGHPYYMLHRADLHRILADAVREQRPDAIKVGHKVTGFRQTTDGVSLQFENGSQANGDVLIGADGVHSAVRRGLFGVDAPQFTGCVAWRGLIPAHALSSRLMRAVGTNWIGPGRHVVHYPVRNGELLNFVGIVERDDWQIESWTERGTTEECAADFAGWHDDVTEMISHIPAPYKWALMGREPLPQWTKGRVSLLGDACHPTLPFLAQGAMMAIEDGFVLARCLEFHQNDPGAGLLRYEELRRERTAKIVRGSAENARRFHNPALNDPAQAQQYVDREWNEASVNARYSWLFEYDATSIPLVSNTRAHV
jgi:salicylate hydroxylase